MHASKEELPMLLEAGDATIRGADWDDMRVAIVSVPAGTDFGPLLKGHPDDLCPSPHWGYVVKGRLKIQSGEGEETLRAGDVFYLPAGHTGVAVEETEFLEVSPPHKHQRFLDVAHRNLEAQAQA
jgi:mannose-6-phosphate isomerase-like protein (cupin superfamily)